MPADFVFFVGFVFGFILAWRLTNLAREFRLLIRSFRHLARPIKQDK